MTQTPPPPPQGTPPDTGPEGGTGWTSPPQPSGWSTPPIAPGPAPGVAYADLVPRVVAFIIDAIILGFGYAIVWTVFLTTIFFAGGFGGLLVGILVSGLVFILASAAYFVYTWTRLRASPGQRVLGLETVNATDGATLTQDQAIRRWLYLFGPSALATILSVAGPALGAISTLVSLAALGYAIYLLYTASQDPKRQGFHDKQANTVVVRRTAAA
ncbi:MAG TPA: RDD family protein [Candidatus Limnocylindrales bacterium]|nr:RDD family protein [Candidatus Limnocylindrales bacterium]